MILYESFLNSENGVIYRLGNEDDLRPIKKITNQLRDTLPFVMNVALKEAISKDELYVAEMDGIVVGFIHFHKRKDGINTIHEIGVSKDYQSKGIGGKLFDLVPIPRRLKTTEDNKIANMFYGKKGMEMIGKEQGKKRILNTWMDPKFESFTEHQNEEDLITKIRYSDFENLVSNSAINQITHSDIKKIYHFLDIEELQNAKWHF